MGSETMKAIENYKRIKKLIEPFKIRPDFDINSKNKYKKIKTPKKF
jgi:hypothetical protein